MRLRSSGLQERHVKLENVASAMHCNLRPPDTTSVVPRFNYDVRTSSSIRTTHVFRYYGISLLIRDVTL